MFIDMDAGLEPPEHAVRRLVNFGWDACFSVSSLLQFLDSYSGLKPPLR